MLVLQISSLLMMCSILECYNCMLLVLEGGLVCRKPPYCNYAGYCQWHWTSSQQSKLKTSLSVNHNQNLHIIELFTTDLPPHQMVKARNIRVHYIMDG